MKRPSKSTVTEPEFLVSVRTPFEVLNEAPVRYVFEFASDVVTAVVVPSPFVKVIVSFDTDAPTNASIAHLREIETVESSPGVSEIPRHVLASEIDTDSDVPSPLWIVIVSFDTVSASVALIACADVLSTFAAMLAVVVDAKFASSPRAAASSLSVFNVPGAASTTALI